MQLEREWYAMDESNGVMETSRGLFALTPKQLLRYKDQNKWEENQLQVAGVERRKYTFEEDESVSSDPPQTSDCEGGKSQDRCAQYKAQLPRRRHQCYDCGTRTENRVRH